jgi:phosphoenolpyruvate-protein kinase (PTS system EI component)
MATKKITLASLAAQMAKGFASISKRIGEMDTRMEKGFAKHGKEIHDLTESMTHVVKHMATKDDIAEVRRDMATKDHVIALATQVNSIETQLRGMKHDKLETRVTDLEDKVFGKIRA